MNLETRLYDERKLGLEQGVKIGIDQGLTQGREEGLTQGRQEGLTQGRQEGHEEGLAQGRNEGRVEAIQAALTFFLNQGQAPTEVVGNLSQMFHLSQQTAQNYCDQLTVKQG